MCIRDSRRRAPACARGFPQTKIQARGRALCELLVAAVTGRLAGAALAGAEEHLLALRGLELDRREGGHLVRTVAERLRLRAPAGAPPIAFAGLDFDRDRRPPADFRFAHPAAPPASVASQASPQAFASSRTRRM